LLIAVGAEIYEAGATFAERIAQLDPLDDSSTLRQWLATYAEFYDRYSGCIDAWAEGTADNSTVVALGENGQVLMDIGAARMLMNRSAPYPFDPVVAALIVRALVTRVPQASLDLPEPMDFDGVVDLMVACIKRGFFGRAS
jgi:hypothetical protein